MGHMTTPNRVPVVIVGAGPTGLTAAIELGVRGVECLVIDRWEDVYPQPRAVHLDDEVYRIIGRLGLGSRFATITRPAAGLRLVDRRLRVLGEFNREGRSQTSGHPRANMFDQPDLERLLRAGAHEQPSVTFRGGVEVTGIEQTSPSTVAVRCREVDSGTEDIVEAELLLGCDGANSVVRDSIGASLQSLAFEQRWLVVDIATAINLNQWDGVHQVCDSSRAATYMRIGATRYRWEFQLLPQEDASDLATIDQLRPLLAPWLAGIDPHGLDLLRTAEYTFRAAIADRWRSDRIFLLGDAAHLTPPFIGQGMGAGLRDAANLGWKAAGFLSGRLAADVLDTYEAERRPHAQDLITLARRLGGVMTGGGRAGDTLRRRLVPVLPRVPGIRRQISDSSTPPLSGSTLISARRGDRLAGHLCPHAEIDGRSIDTLLGAGWGLITLDAPAPTDADTLAARDCSIVHASPEHQLGRWLLEGRARAAVVRPDRTVMASGTDLSTLCAMIATTIAPSSHR